jgi:hypothetical protein
MIGALAIIALTALGALQRRSIGAALTSSPARAGGLVMSRFEI